MNVKIAIGVLVLAGAPVLVAQVGKDDGLRRNLDNGGGIAGVAEPDVTVSRLGLTSGGNGSDDFAYYGSSSGIRAFSAASTSCNVGNATAQWVSGNSGNHPVIAQNLYRLNDGKFEQVGMSWLKHSFCAVSEFTCGACQNTSCSTLGIGCADTYWATLNGDQSGIGPRAQINPQGVGSGGTHTDPHPSPSGNATIRGRLQVSDVDINAGGDFFLEVHYVTHDEIESLRNNNASWRPVSVTTTNISGRSWLGMPASSQDSVRFQESAIEAWVDADPKVNIVDVDASTGGRFHLGYAVTDNQDGTWGYEYALHNMNVHSGAGSFEVPLADGVVVSGTGFHDVDYHSGDGVGNVTRDGTDWAATVGAASVKWETTPFATDDNANALLWGTLYNYRFTANSAPVVGDVNIGLWRDAGVTAVASSVVPGVVDTGSCDGDFDEDGNVSTTDLLELLAAWGSDDALYDIDSSGTVDVGDLLLFLSLWGACP